MVLWVDGVDPVQWGPWCIGEFVAFLFMFPWKNLRGRGIYMFPPPPVFYPIYIYMKLSKLQYHQYPPPPVFSPDIYIWKPSKHPSTDIQELEISVAALLTPMSPRGFVDQRTYHQFSVTLYGSTVRPLLGISP